MAWLWGPLVNMKLQPLAFMAAMALSKTAFFVPWGQRWPGVCSGMAQAWDTGQKFEALHSTNVEPFEKPSEFYHFVGGNHRISTHAQTVAIQGHTYPYFVVNAFIHCNFGKCQNACQGHRTPPAAKHSILRPEPSGSSSSSSSSSMSSSCGNNPD